MLTRRRFLQQTAAGLTVFTGTRSLFGQETSANDKLNIGLIGTANRARGNIDPVRGENIVAVCDIDDRYLSKASAEFPSATTYHDFRKLLTQPNLDAVIISTTDHTHAPATVAALKRGLHVYCEKPLTHSVHEARIVAEWARKSGKATQMGTQIHAGGNYRRVVELVQGGAIGPVREVHVWVGKGWGGGERPTETPPVPDGLHWDLWLGPAPERPYHSTYHPANWRRWWDFGGGTLADMGCHFMDLPFWALKLRAPIRVEAEGPAVHPETCPLWLIVRYEFPARDHLPPVRMTWYDGGEKPEALLARYKLGKKNSGVLFVGDKGALFADYSNRQLLPEDQFKNFVAPEPTIPNSIGHHAEWLRACRTGEATSCNFEYGAALTETVLLGNVAYRSGAAIDWDAAAAKVTNITTAANFLKRPYREGWSL
jgi:predicted dehydrogenase